MLTSGDKFGDYTVIRPLGKGGMGAVYLLQTADDGQVAAKILDAPSDDHESRKRFLREAQLALGVKHPNLVETYDVGEDPDTGLCYILMEYVPGGSLAEYLKEQGALPIEDAVAVVQAIAGVLELARQKGIVHRDIKPGNIMFDAEGTPKLADLGIARGGAAGVETTVTQTGAVIGTPAYMAPEQMLDAHTVDTRADIYSLGVVFFEMLTGERPNKDDTVVQLMAKAVKGEPLPDVRTLRPEVSASLAQLLAMMVAPDKDGRISTPGQITSALGIIARGGTFETRPAAAREADSGRARTLSASSVATVRKFFSWKALVPVGFLVVLVAAFVLFVQRKESRTPEKPLVVRTIVRTNVVEKIVDGTREKKVGVRAAVVSDETTLQSPYRRVGISELGQKEQEQLKKMGRMRKAGQRRGTMAFGTLKIEGSDLGDDVARWAWLRDDGWFSADVWPNIRVRPNSARLVFVRHGYEPLEIDLRREADREWSDTEAFDLGFHELKRLPVDRQCSISATLRLPAGVPEGELILSLDNRSPCGYDWGLGSNLQRPVVGVVNRRFRTGEEVRIDGCSPTDYKVEIRADGCATFRMNVDASDATARNLKTVSLSRVKRATFALRPFSGGEWKIVSVPADGQQSLRLLGESSPNGLRLNPYGSGTGLLVSSFNQPATLDDYGALTTNQLDRQMSNGSLVAPVAISSRSGVITPGRTYRFRSSSRLPADQLIAFVDYREDAVSDRHVEIEKDDDVIREAKENGYKWKYRLVSGGVEITACPHEKSRPVVAVEPKPSGSLRVPLLLDGRPVVAIGPWAFALCKDLRRVEIPEGVRTLRGWGAFFGCVELESIAFPATLRNMTALETFANCRSLKTLSFAGSPPRMDAPRNMNCDEMIFRAAPRDMVVRVHESSAGWAEKWPAGFKSGRRVVRVEADDLNRHAQFAPMLKKRPVIDPRALKDPDPTRAVQKVLDALFPGWKTSEVGNSGSLGYWRERDGETDIICTHPPRRGEPTVLSRTLVVEGKSPVLRVRIANNEEGSQFRLRVRVDGKVVREKDIVAGWTDVCVDLRRWKGKKVKLALEHMPTGWMREWAFWSVIEIADDTKLLSVAAGQEREKPVALFDRKTVVGNNSMKAAQRTCDALFPGWKISECGHPDEAGYEEEHKGRYNLLFTHPPREDVPVVISRRLTLPRKAPKLYVSVIGGEDFELQVKVNGKVVRRSDVNGREWTDLTVDLSEWAGRNVLLEVLNMPTGWQHEEAHWQRIEVR